MRDWGGSDLESLFNQIKTSMPAGAPASLSDVAYADIVAYVLQANAFPAGSSELAAAAIGPIRIEGRNGPAPVPDFALVRVVGCLSQGPVRRGRWLTPANQSERKIRQHPQTTS